MLRAPCSDVARLGATVLRPATGPRSQVSLGSSTAESTYRVALFVSVDCHDVEWPCPNRSIRKSRLFFKR
eukprot:7062202-Prymnesium_polylepis.1